MPQPSVLRSQAENALQQAAFSPKKLVLIHTAVTVGCHWLVNMLNYLLSLLVAQTGGLGGIGMRAVLTTAQSVLELGVTVALPFWEIGLVFAALQWAKGTSATPTDLLTGFRRIGSVLGLRFLQGGLFLLLSFAVVNIGSVIFMMTPLSDPFVELLTPLAEQGVTPAQMEALLTPEWMETAFPAAVPLLIISGVLYAGAAIVLFYRTRFADFALMEGSGAVKALLKSIKITRKRNLQVVKLDLSFWWFYLLQVLCIAIGYSDYLLSALGIALPLSPAVQFFLLSTLSLLLQGILIWQYQSVVLTTYGLAYRTLAAPGIPRQVIDAPGDM